MNFGLTLSKHLLQLVLENSAKLTRKFLPIMGIAERVKGVEEEWLGSMS